MLKQLIGCSLMAASTLAAAQDSPPPPAETRFGVGVDVSILLGIGVSVAMPLPYNLNARGMYHTYTHDEEIEDDGGNYDGEIELKTFGAMLDWFPFGGAFRLTGGLMSNGNEINLAGVANSGNQFEVGDCAYTSNPADPLRVNGRVDFRSTAPYLGIGWGGNMNSGPGLYGTFDIGVMFSGSPKAALSAAGSATVANDGTANDGECGTAGTPVPNAASDPVVQRELRDAENDANEEAKDFKLWPNLSFGIGYRF